MKRILLTACLLVLPFASFAQEQVDVAAEKARITAERSKTEGAFKAAEKACYRKFVVTECINEARAKRRDAMNDLRRQEQAINDAERKRRAAERLHEIEQKSPAAKAAELEQKREKALADQQARQARGEKKAADHAGLAASAPGREATRKASDEKHAQAKATEQSRRVREAADNVRKQKDKLAAADDAKKKKDERLAERKKRDKQVQPLPTPP